MLHKAIFDSAQIHKLLTLLGADLHYIGFRYTEYALLLMEEDEQCIHSVTKCLYRQTLSDFMPRSGTEYKDAVAGGLEIRTRTPSENGGPYT